MNKTMVIIGAGKGISFHVARAFQHSGFNLALVSRKAENLWWLKEQLSEEDNTPPISTYTADVQDTGTLKNTLRQIRQEHRSIDVLFFNVAHISNRNIMEEPEASLMADFKTNVVGLLTSILALQDSLTESDGAILVTGGYIYKKPNPDYASLSLGKAALRNMVESLSRSLPENVFIGTISVNGYVSEKAALHHPKTIADVFLNLYKGRTVLEVII